MKHYILEIAATAFMAFWLLRAYYATFKDILKTDDAKETERGN